MYLIANPIVRYLLIGAIPLLLAVAWVSFRAQVHGGRPLSSFIARWRHR
jgi:hypothetical protein